MGKYEPKHQAPPTTLGERLLHFFDHPLGDVTIAPGTPTSEGTLQRLIDDMKRSEYDSPSSSPPAA